MKVRMWIAALAVATLAACSPKAAGPDAVVKALYEPYIKGPTEAVPPFTDRDVYTADLKAVFAKAASYSALLDGPIIDYDPIIGGQDWVITDVTVTTPKPPEGDTATVNAHFVNQDQTKDIPYAMRLEDGAWRVDEIGAGDESIRGIVDAALKPAGDPAAMEAPVRAIYARYATATGPVPPLHTWAPLGNALRGKLEAAAQMEKRSGAPVLDFDPVVDDKRHELGPVAYEPAANSVIARFDNAGTPKIVVYGVVEENGAWKIDNISAPGSWDVLTKLTDAGVP